MIRILALIDSDKEKTYFGDALKLLNAKVTYTIPSQTPQSLDEVDLILTTLEWVPSWRILIGTAKRTGIPVIYVMDGVLEWSYIWNNQSYIFPNGTALQPLLSDCLCVIGRHPARILASLGLKQKIHIIGLPRLDGIDRWRRVRQSSAKRIMVTTARTYAHNTEQSLSVRQALRDLKQALSELADVAVIWRISPDIADMLGIQANNQESLLDALRDTDALISFPSTSLLEGMLLGIPTALIEYRAVPLYTSCAWEIRSKEHILPVIQELLYPPTEKLAYQSHLLHEELEIGNSSQKLAHLVNEVVSGVSQPLENKTARSFDVPELDHTTELDFRLVHRSISTFAISDNSTLQYELDALFKEYNALFHKLQSLRYLIYDLQRKPLIRIIMFLKSFPGFAAVGRILNEILSKIRE